MPYALACAVFLLAAAAGVPAHANTCLSCHRTLPAPTAGARAYADWKDSVHARGGVTCDRCHGGDPRAASAEAAHRGVRPPSDPRSRVRAAAIPAMCGSCHTAQLAEFRRSRHSRVLQAAGGPREAPTCVTCHGAMHTAVLSPGDVADACAACHNASTGLNPNVPEEAHATLDLIFYARNTVHWSGEFVELARRRGYDVGAAAAALAEARRKYEESKVKWHSFDFRRILELVDGAYEAAKEAKRLADRAVTRGALHQAPAPAAP